MADSKRRMDPVQIRLDTGSERTERAWRCLALMAPVTAKISACSNQVGLGHRSAGNLAAERQPATRLLSSPIAGGGL